MHQQLMDEPADGSAHLLMQPGSSLQVFQVRHRGNGHIYAMKVMRKDRILQRDHSEYVRSERDLLTSVLHPYIVTLRYSFQVRRIWICYNVHARD